MRKAELFNRVANSLVVIHPNAVAPAGHVNRITRLGVHLHMEEFRAKTPMRHIGGKPKTTDTVVGRRFEVSALERNIVKGKIGPAALVEIQITVLREGDSSENRKLNFRSCRLSRTDEDGEQREGGQECRFQHEEKSTAPASTKM
jgi:hypothetical protein